MESNSSSQITSDQLLSVCLKLRLPARIPKTSFLTVSRVQRQNPGVRILTSIPFFPSTFPYQHNFFYFWRLKFEHPRWQSTPGISKHFGSDSTGGGIGWQFRAIKADAKRQQTCVKAGGDPKDLDIGKSQHQKFSFLTARFPSVANESWAAY